MKNLYGIAKIRAILKNDHYEEVVRKLEETALDNSYQFTNKDGEICYYHSELNAVFYSPIAMQLAMNKQGIERTYREWATAKV